MGRKGISPAQTTVFPGSSEIKAEPLSWRKTAVSYAAPFSQDDSLWDENCFGSRIIAHCQS